MGVAIFFSFQVWHSNLLSSSGSFAISCEPPSGDERRRRRQSDAGFTCECEPNYAGETCGLCGPGYYGEPQVVGECNT